MITLRSLAVRGWYTAKVFAAGFLAGAVTIAYVYKTAEVREPLRDPHLPQNSYLEGIREGMTCMKQITDGNVNAADKGYCLSLANTLFATKKHTDKAPH